jgi:hypothetical protein
MQQAEKQLADAQQKLAEAKKQAQQDLVNEQMARLEQLVHGLIQRQKSVTAEIVRLAELLKTQAGKWTDAQRASVQTLATQQRDLAADTGQMATNMADAEVFAVALRGAVREMVRVAQRLETDDVGDETHTASLNAELRLEQLLTALKPDQPNDDPPKQNDNQDSQDMQPAVVHSVAELKLLRLMQGELNRRTAELESKRSPQGKLTSAQQQELEQLAAEQGHLADIVLKLVRQAAGGPTELPKDTDANKKAAPSLDLDDLDEALKKSIEKK